MRIINPKKFKTSEVSDYKKRMIESFLKRNLTSNKK
jgi:hypothetical protein